MQQKLLYLPRKHVKVLIQLDHVSPQGILQLSGHHLSLQHVIGAWVQQVASGGFNVEAKECH